MSDVLDAAAARRVLQRANELADAGCGPEGYRPEALIAAALEVGIPERAARQSLAIERFGAAPETHRCDRWFGASSVWDECVIELPADHVLDLLDRWLVVAHHLRRQGAGSDEVVWAYRDDLVAGVRRRFSGLFGEGRLAAARSVKAKVHPLDASSTMVRVVVDRRLHRRASLIGGWTLGAGGVALIVLGVVVAAPLVLLAIPLAIVGGALAWANRRQSDRFRRELARLLGAVGEARSPQRIVSSVRRRLSSSPAG